MGMDGACKESGGFSEPSFVDELGAADCLCQGLGLGFFVCGCLGLNETSHTLSLACVCAFPLS